VSDEAPPPRPKEPWLDLERFRSARAFGYGGCILPVVLAVVVIARLVQASRSPSPLQGEGRVGVLHSERMFE